MGRCPHIDLRNWLSTCLDYLFFPLYSTDKCCVHYGEFTLVICCFDFVCFVCCHGLFCHASISFQFRFVSSILYSALPVFTRQVAATSDITVHNTKKLLPCTQTKKMWAANPFPQCALTNWAADTFEGRGGVLASVVSNN